jgi:hypothetical protein
MVFLDMISMPIVLIISSVIQTWLLVPRCIMFHQFHGKRFMIIFFAWIGQNQQHVKNTACSADGRITLLSLKLNALRSLNQMKVRSVLDSALVFCSQSNSLCLIWNYWMTSLVKKIKYFHEFFNFSYETCVTGYDLYYSLTHPFKWKLFRLETCTGPHYLVFHFLSNKWRW